MAQVAVRRTALPPRQRRLRHVHSVMARNLLPPASRGLLNTYFTVHLEGGAQPIYTSEVVWHSLNPSWMPVAFPGGESHRCCDTPVFIVRVWDLDEDSPSSTTLLVELAIDLLYISYVGEDLACFQSLPPNTLLLELADGLYSFGHVAQSLSSILNAPPKPRNRQVSSGQDGVRKVNIFRVKELFQQILKMQETQQHTLRSIEEARSKLESRLDSRAPQLRQARSREMHQYRLSVLEKEYKEHMVLLEEDRRGVEELRESIVPSARAVSEAEEALLKGEQSLREERAPLERDCQRAEQLCRMLDLRRRQLLEQFASIYTIERLSDQSTYTIAGIKLPNSEFQGCDEEHIATALGAAAHLLFLTAKYLEVSLRYRITAMSSRSTIRDDVAGSPAEYPLYSRGVEKQKFEHGVALLNKDIEQLLTSQGLIVTNTKNTLPNLFMLLNHLALPIHPPSI
eukprot:TRINITY_DN23235_c0_g1_i1.p1 TRINITY_DN23235_c0_g1~~TRINITY_DN23235_c0_g1_i1.p1  ORF type:complete len:455 (-),score=64.42 TRINITY_DN23235_c0_g1_i1:3-1367(-)